MHMMTPIMDDLWFALRLRVINYRACVVRGNVSIIGKNYVVFRIDDYEVKMWL